MLPDQLIDEVARLFALLGDPTRLRLVRALHEHGELALGDLAERTGTSVANASQHLLRLAAAGVLARRRDGKSVLYRIEDPRLEELCDTVCASVRDRARLLAHAEIGAFPESRRQAAGKPRPAREPSPEAVR